MIRKRPPADNTMPGPKLHNVYWDEFKKYRCPACNGYHDVADRQLDDRGKLVIPPTCPHLTSK